jgi:hypothetical protein
VLLDNPISCDITRRDFLGEANNQFAMSCTVFSDISGLPPPCRSNNVPLVSSFKLFNKPSLATGTSNLIGLHNEHLLFQRISIHLHYDVKASKHLASLLTTDVSMRERALSQRRIIRPMFFNTTVTNQVFIEHTGGHFQHLL